MPQFDLANFAPQLVWLALFFGILYFGIVRLTLPRLGNVVTARENMVQADLAAAHHAKAEADGTRALYESAMVNARHEAQAAIEASRSQAARLVEERLHATDATLGGRLDQAMAAIEASRRAAAGDMRRVAGEAAADIVQALTGERPDEDRAAAAVSAVQAG